MSQDQGQQFDGSRIRSKRQEAGLTQAKAAELVGVSPVYFQSLEVGRKTPSLDILFRLAAVLGCEAGDFLPSSGGEPKPARRIFITSNAPKLTRFKQIEERFNDGTQGAVRVGGRGLRAVIRKQSDDSISRGKKS